MIGSSLVFLSWPLDAVALALVYIVLAACLGTIASEFTFRPLQRDKLSPPFDSIIAGLLAGMLMEFVNSRWTGRAFMQGLAENYLLLVPMLATAALISFLYHHTKKRRRKKTALPVAHAPEAIIDLTPFQTLFRQIQAHWSAGDLAQLRPLMTPEMFQYYQDRARDDQNQGLVNIVTDIQLEDSYVIEAWTETDPERITIEFSWKARDYMVRKDRHPGDADYLVSGSDMTDVALEECWTFIHTSSQAWLLSDISNFETR